MAYFVTGATGFIGRHLVQELLDHREGDVFVLCRAGSMGRLETLMRRWGSDRVVPVVGDLSEEGLGVDPQWVDEHRGSIDHVVHLAAIYDMTADDATNEVLNVGGTRHAVELAGALEAGCFHQVSSVAAAGDFKGRFSESMFDEGQHLPSPYHRTKFESERIVREESTVPWRVYRPAIVVGHSETGAMDKVDGPYYFFPLMKALRDRLPSWLPLVGVDLGSTNVVPVDYVAKAIDHLAHVPGRDGEAFHLVNPDPQPTVEMINLFCKAAGAPQFATPASRLPVPTAVPRRARSSTPWCAPARRRSRSTRRWGASASPPRSSPTPASPRSSTPRRTEHALAGSGIAVPDLESYASSLWGYWEENLDESTGKDARTRAALQGKHVLITGASSGIGQVTALKVAQAGGIPVLVARGKDKLEETKSVIEMRGGTAHVFPCDLSDLESIDRLCEQVTAELPTDRLRHQQRRPLDPPLAAAEPRPVPRLRAHDAAQLLRRDPADHGPDPRRWRSRSPATS